PASLAPTTPQRRCPPATATGTHDSFDLAACCDNGSCVYSDGHNNASGNHHNPNTGDFDHGSDNYRCDNHRCDNHVDAITCRINHHRCHHHDSTQLRHGPQHDDYA
ncbi:MAG: hypothetical protein MK196_10195, partial [Acidimicrobiales bacterium]|nr:hypothetical protein [Acidimicrobiales bacterium]